MSKLIDSIIVKAKSLNKTIVLPEGEEKRIILAAEKLAEQGVAKIILLGNEAVIKIKCGEADLSKVTIINPATSEKLEAYTEFLYEARKSKGMTKEQAMSTATDPLYFGAIMTKMGDADGMVAGSINSTGSVLRPGLQVVKTAEGINTVSSCFLMSFDGTLYSDNQVMVFGDCAVNIDPSAEQLADIAISSVQSAIQLAGIAEPKVAMLSFSTKGSAKHPFVDKVITATKIVQEKCPNLLIDGELQVDAALVPNVAELKSPGSKIQGKANILIFPNLDSGNIGYKLAQRLACAEAIGPICQGFAKPINDLSRGCSVDDVVAVVAITAVQSEIIN